MWSVEAVDVEQVRPLREQVLRPGQTSAQLAYAGDDDPSSLHMGVAWEGRLVGVASVMVDLHPLDPRPGDWRIRGMATRAEIRGRGVGAALLSRCESHVRELGGRRVWCNARVGARAFYQRAGFVVEGDEFEIPEIGAHFLMSKALDREERARSFGRVAGEYQRGRPGYPREAIAWLLGEEPLEVLDLGAGTGKLTAALLEAGHGVIAVEPLEEMRSVLIATLPAARALAGRAEELPLADSSVDAVTVGAAFHWFEQEAAGAEIARVLRPPGILGLLGNTFDISLPWVARVRELLGPPAIERRGHWPSVEQLRERYEEVEDREFSHLQPIDAAALRDLAVSRSSVALMSPPKREDVLAGLDRTWLQEPELQGRDTALLPWRTRVRRCRGLLG